MFYLDNIAIAEKSSVDKSKLGEKSKTGQLYCYLVYILYYLYYTKGIYLNFQNSEGAFKKGHLKEGGIDEVLDDLTFIQSIY